MRSTHRIKHDDWGWKTLLEKYQNHSPQSRTSWSKMLRTVFHLSFEYLQEWRLQNLSVSSVSVFAHPPSKKALKAHAFVLWSGFFIFVIVSFYGLNGAFSHHLMPVVSCPVNRHYWEKSSSLKSSCYIQDIYSYIQW